MILYTICQTAFKNIASGSGKKGRWNEDNEFVRYFASTKSLSVLEKRVHTDNLTSLIPHTCVELIIRDAAFYANVSEAPKSLNLFDDDQCLKAGSKWYKSNKSLFLKVPSVLSDKEFNVIFNVNHPDSLKFLKDTNVVINESPFVFDPRLFKS